MNPEPHAEPPSDAYLPILAVVRERVQVLLEGGVATRRELEQVVELDAALIGAVHRVARCSIFGGQTEHMPLPELLQRVGRPALGTLIESLPGLAADEPDRGVDDQCRFWLEAIALAAAARWLANMAGHAKPEDVYVAGLLYDVGARLAGEIDDVGDAVEGVLGRWRLPQHVAKVVVDAWRADEVEVPPAADESTDLRGLVERGAVIAARLGHRSIPLQDVPFTEFELEGAGEAIELEFRHVAEVLELPFLDVASVADALVAAELRRRAELPDLRRPTAQVALRDVAAVHQSLLAARGMSSINDILNGALRVLYRGLSFERVMLLEPEAGRTDYLRARAAPLHPIQARLRRGYGAVVVPMDLRGGLRTALTTGMPMRGDTRTDTIACAHLGVTSFAAAPLTAGPHQMGVILADRFLTDRLITDGDVAMLGLLTASLGMAIENMALETQGRKLRALAEKDELTGINNRRNQLQELQRELDRCRRYGTPLSVVMIDVDHFKRWNDIHGHQVGDTVLSSVAQIIASCSRDIDHFGRWGGEEFLVALPETTIDRAVIYAERLRVAIEQHGGELAELYPGNLLTVSIGVSSLAPRGDDISALVNRADEALYSAKNSGRNQVHVREPGVPVRPPSTCELSEAPSGDRTAPTGPPPRTGAVESGPTRS